jgi:hypothetical protein
MSNDSTVPPSAKRRPPGGSRKGIPNKATATFRETVSRLLEDNAENVALWLRQVAEGQKGRTVGGKRVPGRAPDPAGALMRLAYLAEFASPKLSRAEVTGEGGGPVTVVIHKEGQDDPADPD